MSDPQKLPIVITNAQKKRLIDALITLIEVGNEVAETFCESHADELDENKLNQVAEVIGLALVGFPWAAALNIFVEEGDEDKIKLAWSFAEIMGTEFHELFAEYMFAGNEVTH